MRLGKFKTPFFKDTIGHETNIGRIPEIQVAVNDQGVFHLQLGARARMLDTPQWAHQQDQQDKNLQQAFRSHCHVLLMKLDFYDVDGSIVWLCGIHDRCIRVTAILQNDCEKEKYMSVIKRYRGMTCTLKSDGLSLQRVHHFAIKLLWPEFIQRYSPISYLPRSPSSVPCLPDVSSPFHWPTLRT